jgi:hypothetical protein
MEIKFSVSSALRRVGPSSGFRAWLGYKACSAFTGGGGHIILAHGDYYLPQQLLIEGEDNSHKIIKRKNGM